MKGKGECRVVQFVGISWKDNTLYVRGAWAPALLIKQLL